MGTPCEDVRQDLVIATAAGHCDRLTSQGVGGDAVAFADGSVAGQHTKECSPAAEVMFVDDGERVLQQLSGLRLRHARSDPPRPCDGRLGQQVGGGGRPSVLYGPAGGFLCAGDITECASGLVLCEEQPGSGFMVRWFVPPQQLDGSMEVRYRVLVGELLESLGTGALGPGDCLGAAPGGCTGDEVAGELRGLGVGPA